MTTGLCMKWILKKTKSSAFRLMSWERNCGWDKNDKSYLNAFPDCVSNVEFCWGLWNASHHFLRCFIAVVFHCWFTKLVLRASTEDSIFVVFLDVFIWSLIVKVIRGHQTWQNVFTGSHELRFFVSRKMSFLALKQLPFHPSEIWKEQSDWESITVVEVCSFVPLFRF